MSKSNDFNDENSNTSANPTFDSVLQARLSRRGLMRGGVGTVGVSLLGGMGLAACGGGDDNNAVAAVEEAKAGVKKLGFTAVPKSLADSVVIPAGYTASVIYALGDPLKDGVGAYQNDGTDDDYEDRAGDHHDGMEWFGLDADGNPSLTSNDRGLLAMNHEATTDARGKFSSFFLHDNGGTKVLPRPGAEVDKETAIHGISVVEVQATNGKWATLPASARNFRLTSLSQGIQINGPARGNALMVTKYSPLGTLTRGTLNNCGTGKTPWGTFLTGEENWAGYFTRSISDDAARNNDKSVTSLNRYGRKQGAASRHGWETGGADDKYARWNISKLGNSTDGRDDYRNELNTFGYIVEIDAYDKTKAARKRTALGRFAHESAAFGTPKVGQPLAVYMGDDSIGEYIYKFVSAKAWVASDANPADRITTGDTYLDYGKLYVAKFNSDGKGEWIELSLSKDAIKGYADYRFADQADVLVNARLAADAVGATKMDRPEWSSTNVNNGEIYITLTKNDQRAVESPKMPPDSANPRVYDDSKDGKTQPGNVNGHVLRMKEGSAGNAALSFTWDVYVFGAQSDADAGTVNLSNLTADQDFSSPDGLVFSPATGIMWIQTDDGSYTDVTNCMMLAALPGSVGDGAKKTLTYTKADSTMLAVDTYVGKAPGNDNLKRFLVGPKGCEITGLCETPDGKAIFVNIQHPGENTPIDKVVAYDLNSDQYESQWPSNAGYGLGKRPRSATIVITKNDGGVIGS